DGDSLPNDSRMYIVKNALYNMVSDPEIDIRWGFASFYQEKDSSASDTWYRVSDSFPDHSICNPDVWSFPGYRPDIWWHGATKDSAYEAFQMHVEMAEGAQAHINEILRERNAVLMFVLLFSFISAILVSAKPVDVLLKPAEYGKPSKAVPIGKNKPELPEVMPIPRKLIKVEGIENRIRSTVDRILAYDTGTYASSLGGLAQGFHLGVWFQSPAACTLLEIRYYFNAGGAVTYYATDPSDTIDFLNDYEEYKQKKT
ncbi:unnamed protein product, partial [marine sediment metagenome]